MLIIAITKATEKLERAKAHFLKLEFSRSFRDFRAEWNELLLAGNSLYPTLEQGAKTFAQSRQWFGGKKTERKADPLLQYMHQARNADEHGLDRIVKTRGFSLKNEAFSRYGGVLVDGLSVSETGEMEASFTPLTDHKSIDASTPLVGLMVELVPVKNDRFNDTFFPPDKHLGIAIADRSPVHVAALWLKYLATILEEARSLG